VFYEVFAEGHFVGFDKGSELVFVD